MQRFFDFVEKHGLRFHRLSFSQMHPDGVHPEHSLFVHLKVPLAKTVSLNRLTRSLNGVASFSISQPTHPSSESAYREVAVRFDLKKAERESFLAWLEKHFDPNDSPVKDPVFLDYVKNHGLRFSSFSLMSHEDYEGKKSNEAKFNITLPVRFALELYLFHPGLRVEFGKWQDPFFDGFIDAVDSERLTNMEDALAKHRKLLRTFKPNDSIHVSVSGPLSGLRFGAFKAWLEDHFKPLPEKKVRAR